MNKEELFTNYFAKKKHKKRKVGRYYASELYGIMYGYEKPEDFFKIEELSMQSMENILRGIVVEDAMTKIFEALENPPVTQEKKEVKITSEITIVAKIDFRFGDAIAEVKAPTEMPDAIKKSNMPQLELYYQAFEMPIYIWYVNATTLEMKVFKYTHNPSVWRKIKRDIIKYHEAVKDLPTK